jgi:exodeoxyribonuclease VII small subunit
MMAKGGPSEVGDLTYEEASEELDSIVAFFEGSDVDVDELVARLERATALVDELERRLVATRMQVEELSPKLVAAAADQAGSIDPETGEIVDG